MSNFNETAGPNNDVVVIKNKDGLEPGVATRMLAAKILARIIREDSWATPVIDKALSVSQFDTRDRNFVSNLVFSTLRYLGTVDYVIKKSVKRDLDSINPTLLAILRCGTWELAMGKAPQHAVVYAAVEAGVAMKGPNVAAFINGGLRGVARFLDEGIWPSTDEAFGLGLNLGYPEWIVNEAYDRFGEDRFISTLEGGNEVPTVHLRAVKKRDDILEQMERAGQKAHASEITPHGIVLDERVPVAKLKVVKSGQAIVQDQASQLVIQAALHQYPVATIEVIPEPMAVEYDEDGYLIEADQDTKQDWDQDGDRGLDRDHDNHEQVRDAEHNAGKTADKPAERHPIIPVGRALDMCAAPGGKATYLAQLGFHVTAHDINPARLRRVVDMAKRIKVNDNMHIQPKNGLEPLDANEAPYPLVLLDAPCSGLGVMRRRPEIRWRKTQYDLDKLHQLQCLLLERALQNVAAGGRVIYSVCTWTEAETDAVIAEVVAKHDNVTIQDPSDFPHGTKTKYGIQFMPDQEEADGMYVAILNVA